MSAARTRPVRGQLQEIRDAAEDVVAFTAELDEAGFLALPGADRRTYRALKNALTEICEKVHGLPPDLLARHPGVDWRGWAGLGGLVSHPYFGPDLHRLQPVVADEVPALLAAISAELSQPEENCGDGPSPGREP